VTFGDEHFDELLAAPQHLAVHPLGELHPGLDRKGAPDGCCLLRCDERALQVGVTRHPAARGNGRNQVPVVACTAFQIPLQHEVGHEVAKQR
jgi:hypothetical protein